MPVFNFITWIANKILDEANAELYDPDKIQAELINISLQLEAGEITEKDYNKKEADLLDRLEESQENFDE